MKTIKDYILGLYNENWLLFRNGAIKSQSNMGAYEPEVKILKKKNTNQIYAAH
jgi:hypothetical protein